MTAPCKDCPNRTVEPNCHDTCPLYLAYKEEREAIRRARLADDDAWKQQWDRGTREWFMRRKRRGL